MILGISDGYVEILIDNTNVSSFNVKIQNQKKVSWKIYIEIDTTLKPSIYNELLLKGQACLIFSLHACDIFIQFTRIILSDILIKYFDIWNSYEEKEVTFISTFFVWIDSEPRPSINGRENLERHSYVHELLTIYWHFWSSGGVSIFQKKKSRPLRSRDKQPNFVFIGYSTHHHTAP